MASVLNLGAIRDTQTCLLVYVLTSSFRPSESKNSFEGFEHTIMSGHDLSSHPLTDLCLSNFWPFTNVSWCLKRVSKGFELTTSAHLRNAPMLRAIRATQTSQGLTFSFRSGDIFQGFEPTTLSTHGRSSYPVSYHVYTDLPYLLIFSFRSGQSKKGVLNSQR